MNADVFKKITFNINNPDHNESLTHDNNITTWDKIQSVLDLKVLWQTENDVFNITPWTQKQTHVYYIIFLRMTLDCSKAVWEKKSYETLINSSAHCPVTGL